MKRAAKIILINNKKEMLLQLRDNKPGIPHPGYWDFIGGEIEEKETPLQAVKREMQEDIGFEAKNIKFIDKINSEHFENSVFIGITNVPTEQIDLKEGQKFGFFKFKDLKKIKFPKIWMDFIDKHKEILK